MLEFIKKIDYVGEFGYKKENIEKAIADETERFWSLFEKEIAEEGYFGKTEKAK